MDFMGENVAMSLFLLLNPTTNGKVLMGMKQLVWDFVKE
jgi:hypothetical protein